MTKRTLLFTTGSPFARAVRITLDELGLEYERREEITTPSVEDRAQASPTLQVPTLWDGDVRLWESSLIVEYLLSTYTVDRGGDLPICDGMGNPETIWRDRLVLSTIQTLGTAGTTISQMKWGGVAITDHAYLKRSADRFPYLMEWLENEISETGNGFIPGILSAQDIFLSCHLDFILNRPLGLDPMIESYPKILELVTKMRKRESFESNPILWWEPGVIGYSSKNEPIYAKNA
ncbi:MAG: glutathione S-transferase family protein [Gammaproteobacteria bacterium]|nr:glutathione S-transferase family protein [Gammaproteobacteria bacterium]